MPTLMLVDGNSLTYRAFHALPQDLATASGQVTNAVLGFTSMLINLVAITIPTVSPSPLIGPSRPSATRRSRPTRRIGRRHPTSCVSRWAWCVRSSMCSTSRRSTSPGTKRMTSWPRLPNKGRPRVSTCSSSPATATAFQLVSDPRIKVVYNKRGVSDYALYDEAGILERTGVTPDLYVQYAALRGDTSDNLPGVAGVGEKTAAKLINKYGGIDGLYEHVDEQTPKLRENLAAMRMRSGSTWSSWT